MEPVTARHRLTRAAVVVAAACALLVGTGNGSDDESGPVAPESASAAVGDSPDLYTGPPRGSLADDTAYVDAVRRLSWRATTPNSSPVADPPPESRWVVFAGDVPGGRWAFVVARVSPRAPVHDRAGLRPLLAAWFGGSADARPADLVLRTAPVGIDRDTPSALLDVSTGALVVVAAPGDVIEVSERPLVAADGNVTRTYRRVYAPEGIAVVQVAAGDRSSGHAVTYRVHRGNRVLASTPPWVIGEVPGPAVPDVEQSRGTPSSTGALAVTRAAQSVLTRLGLPADDVRATTVWTGDVPGPGPAGGAAAVVAVTVPSGAIVVDGEWVLMVRSPSDSYVQGGDCGLAVLPAGPPMERRVLALGCEIVDPQDSTVRTVLLVVAPPEVAVVRLYDERSQFLAELPADAGIVVAPLSADAVTVEAVTSGGVSLGRTALLGRGVDFGD